jgi:cytochrome c peroxidase
LRDYQLRLLKPSPPPNSFDQEAATRGQAVFDGAGRCTTCHIPPLYTDVNLGMLHDPAETGMNAAYADRTTTRQYRTTPLRALWQHAPYFHDGSAATLRNVVEHYNAFLRLGLTDDQMRDLVEFLKSI